MVCHESYKDINGDWLYPNEIQKVNANKAVRLKTKRSKDWST